MSDNLTLGGSDVATDDVAGVHYQRVKVTHGVDGTAVDASADAPLPVAQQAATADLDNVAASATSVTLLAQNTDRRGGYVFNDSTVEVYIKFGSAASTTSFTVRVLPMQFYELPTPVYTGIVTGIWPSATGTARVTEVI